MLRNYFKVAWKILGRHKLFTFISLFGISFTLFILTIVVSLIDHTFGAQPPENRLKTTLTISFGRLESERGGVATGPLFSPYFLQKTVKTLTTPAVTSMSSFHHPIVVYENDIKQSLDLKFTDGEFWKIMDFVFLEGRPYTVREVQDYTPVAVINDQTRERFFDNDSAIGKMITVEGTRFRVVGVVENIPILRMYPYADIWVPLTFSKEDLDEVRIMGNFPGWYGMALAQDPDDIPEIKAEFKSKLAQIDDPDGHWVDILTGANSYAEGICQMLFKQEEGDTGPIFLILFVVMVVFMLLPTVNLININVSRIMDRASEIGVRKAFGASSLTLVGQFIVENIIITVLGGVISLIMAWIVLGIVNHSGAIEHAHFTLNGRIFLWSMGICLFFGLFSGVYPAWRMSRLQPVDALRGGPR